MFSTKTFLLGACLAACALGQTRIAFTSVPALAVAGESYNLTWAGGDGSPVTITLREGTSNDLKTIETLVDGVTENFYVWDVSKSLATASDYTLQITQGQDAINYSGLFSVAGGTGASSISLDTASTTGSSNATALATASTSSTIASMGTGSPFPRNTTFSVPTISSTTTSLEPAITQHMSRTSSPAPSSAPASPSPTTATTTTTTSAPSGAAVQLGSSVALAMGVFAAVMFLS